MRWPAKGTDTRPPAKPATLAQWIASIAREHCILGFGEKEPLPTQAGMMRDTYKAIRRKKRQRQRQAAPFRLGEYGRQSNSGWSSWSRDPRRPPSPA